MKTENNEKLKITIDLLKLETKIINTILKQEEQKTEAILKRNTKLLFSISEKTDLLSIELANIESKRNYNYKNYIAALSLNKENSNLSKIEQKYFLEKERLRNQFQQLRKVANSNTSLLKQNITIINKTVMALVDSRKVQTYNKRGKTASVINNHSESLMLNIKS